MNPIEFLIGLIKNGDTVWVIGLIRITVMLQRIDAARANATPK